MSLNMSVNTGGHAEPQFAPVPRGLAERFVFEQVGFKGWRHSPQSARTCREICRDGAIHAGDKPPRVPGCRKLWADHHILQSRTCSVADADFLKRNRCRNLCKISGPPRLHPRTPLDSAIGSCRQSSNAQQTVLPPKHPLTSLPQEQRYEIHPVLAQRASRHRGLG